MAKYQLRLKARELRKQGLSVKKIAAHLGVSKGTASIWVRDIILTVEQLEELRQESLKGSERGRLKNAFLQKERWLKNLAEFKEAGKKSIGLLSKRELLIAGLCLYWAEGYKKGRRLQFCNSDPQMIIFLLRWLINCFGVQMKDIRCRVGINEIHRSRDNIIREYWSQTTGVSLGQFTSTSFKKVINKKVYENFSEYYGTLSIEIAQPSRFYGKIIGLIEGLSYCVNKMAG